MDGAWKVSEIRQILQTTHVDHYIQPLKMALLDDICRFLKLTHHRGVMTDKAERRQTQQDQQGGIKHVQRSLPK